jgi:hypothetical protein
MMPQLTTEEDRELVLMDSVLNPPVLTVCGQLMLHGVYLGLNELGLPAKRGFYNIQIILLPEHTLLIGAAQHILLLFVY